MKMRFVTLLAAAALALGACSGSDGKDGKDGAQGPQGPAGSDGGAGPAGPAGPQGPAGPAGPASPGGSGGGALPAGAGLKFEIVKATAVTGSAPTVQFKVTDGFGQPIDLLAEVDSWGSHKPAFGLAHLEGGEFKSYIVRNATGAPYMIGATETAPKLGSAAQANTDSWTASRVVKNADGSYTYTFSAAFTVDPAATQRVAIYGGRVINGVEYGAVETKDFVPAGGTPVVREIVSNDACNKCHGELVAHGARRKVEFCVMCHNTQTTDPETGNKVGMAELVHKIHSGSPTYAVAGYRQTYYAYDHVKLPPSHSTYLEGGSNAGLIRDCAICHKGASASRAETTITRAACTTCHENVNFATGEGHTQLSNGQWLAVNDDLSCVGCHGQGTTYSVAKVHAVNYDATTNTTFATPKYEVTIDDVTVVAGKPEISFTVKLDGAGYDITTKKLGSLAFQVAGPTTDYSFMLTSPPSALTSGVASTAVTPLDAANGKFKFVFPTAVLAGKTGTFAFGGESYYKETVGAVSRPTAAKITLFPKTITNGESGSTAGKTGSARRVVASNDKCNACHVQLGFHSNSSRLGVDYCATCHNSTLDNSTRVRFTREAGSNGGTVAVESVQIGIMTHRIHMGEELPSVQAGGEYVLGAQRGDALPSDSDFSHFLSPNPASNCKVCHDGETYALPVQANVPVKTSIMNCGPDTANDKTDANGAVYCGDRKVVKAVTTGPQAAVCLSCHDSDYAKAHAALQTTDGDGDRQTFDGVETCAACHGKGAEWDSLKVHAVK